MFRLLAIVVCAIAAGGCGLLSYQVDDPNQVLGIRLHTEELVRSLRCEVITFIVENRIRSAIFSTKTGALIDPQTNKIITKNQALLDDAEETLRRYPFIELDETQYAALGVDLKNINTGTLNAPADWKTSSKTSAVTRDYHLGPSFADTDTFEYIPPLAIPQNADLGPTVSYNPPNGPPPAHAAVYSTIYFYQPSDDESFYCYKSLAFSHAKSMEDAADDIEALLVNADGAERFAQFKRIYIRTITLANWLQEMAGQLGYNSHTLLPTPENVLVGQIGYTFTLDWKPSVDLKYTYTGYVVNPFVPELSAGVEHSGQFSIYLNTAQSVPVTQAKTGNSCNKSVGNCTNSGH